jgi:hypothetical protein
MMTNDNQLGVKIAYDPSTKLIRIEFATAIGWIAIPPEQALHLAEALMRQVMNADQDKACWPQQQNVFPLVPPNTK